MSLIGPMDKLPKFYSAVRAVEQSVSAPITETDRLQACDGPPGLHPSAWAADWVTVGTFYSARRSQECSLAGDHRRAWSWGVAAAAAVIATHTGVAALVGFLAGAAYRCKHHAERPYVRRTEEGVREHLVCRSLNELQAAVVALSSQTDMLCLTGAMRRSEIAECYADAASVVAATEQFVASHPKTRIRGSAVLYAKTKALGAKVAKASVEVSKAS